ncbi:hypothetical protein HAX54_049078 [Datura stramonium]|uniref:Uncharacterized protein n=1 Tax=Datura stramonium TaxID=4076 RepID=A0ABS8SVB7_DATST|nr:hypothetical protein [Datura stramonium]
MQQKEWLSFVAYHSDAGCLLLPSMWVLDLDLKRRIGACMDCQISDGRSTCLLKIYHLAFQSLFLVLTLLETGCNKTNGFLLSPITVMFGFLLLPSMSVLDLDLVKQTVAFFLL